MIARRTPQACWSPVPTRSNSLAAFFSIGEKPTGSRDPFALRRAAQGVIRLILENGLRLPLAKAFALARSGPGLPAAVDLGELQTVLEDLLVFVADRLKVHLRDQGVRHDLIAAAFAQLGVSAIPDTGGYEDDLVRLMARVRALGGFLLSEDGVGLLTAYRRAANIVRIEDRKEGHYRRIDVDRSLLREPEELTLADSLDGIGERAGRLLTEERFEAAMTELAGLRQPVDAFFEKVTVNTDDPRLRENRLRLLSRIRGTMNQVADFSLIEG